MNNPAESIVPIVAIDDSNNIIQFLGTGVFIDNGKFLVTAEHVIRGWEGPYAITIFSEVNVIYKATLILKDRRTDLALLHVAEYSPKEVISLANESEIKMNQAVVCLEYGTTLPKGREILFAPATRLGNVTRTLNLTDRYGKAGQDALELSFPALRGSSGAPVISNSNFRLWGIVIANVNYHLLPSQIEQIFGKENQIFEETQFMLPQAIAVHVKHLHELLEGIN